MHKVALCLLTMALASLAGCTDAGTPTGTPVQAEPQYADEVVQVAAPTMPREAPAAGERTLDEAPQWRLGEWWTYRMTDGFTGGTYEFTRVVAGEDRNAGNYLVGFPVDEFSNDVMLFHIPGFGDIRQADLAYETHDAYFQPLQFPLADGANWETEFEGTGLGNAFVTVTEPGKADINILTGGGHNITATYDAQLGEISKMNVLQGGGLYADYEVIAHGFDYQGIIRVPHAHDLVFIHGRLAGVVDVGPNASGPASTSITETVPIEPGYDRVAFIIAVGAGAFLGTMPVTGGPIPGAGYFQETVTAPDGTQFQGTYTPLDYAAGQGLLITAHGHDNPEGSWTLQHIAAGAGVAFVEGIGYHSIDVDLPSGCVIASFNAQHHNADCKTTYDQAGKGMGGNSTTGAP